MIKAVFFSPPDTFLSSYVFLHERNGFQKPFQPILKILCYAEDNVCLPNALGAASSSQHSNIQNCWEGSFRAS